MTKAFVTDLDETLIRVDVSGELLMVFLRARPFSGLFLVLFWSLKGRGYVKSRLTQAVGHAIAVGNVPVFQNVLDFVQQQNRPIALVSGSHEAMVRRIAQRWQGMFDHCAGSPTSVNLTGPRKAAYLKKQFPEGFDYIGDSRVDLHVWKAAKKAYAVNVSKAVARDAEKQGIDLEILSYKANPFPALLRCMRFRQWLQNLFVFTALPVNMIIFSMAGFSWGGFMRLVLAFLSLCAMTGALSILRDIFSIEQDRQHPARKKGPFASGAVRLPMGFASLMLLCLISFSLGGMISLPFLAMLIGYAALFLFYIFSLEGKRVIGIMGYVLVLCWLVMVGIIAFMVPI